MKIVQGHPLNPHGITVELTRRNLNALLAKLDGSPPDSNCTIFKDHVFVKAVEDVEHYSDRQPGLMVPETEEAMVHRETAQ